jgi:hypothetical protein
MKWKNRGTDFSFKELTTKINFEGRKEGRTSCIAREFDTWTKNEYEASLVNTHA